MGDAVEQAGSDVIINLKIVPGSSKTAISGLLDGRLKIKIAAPPEKGKANECLIDFLAGRLGVKKNDLSVISGQTSPVKQVRACCVTVEKVRQKLGL
ncbi:MAG: YggU family protein [Planctomycetes bacterium GWF2_50_10]|nr:MAG: YggU family protein [Planctomycetes bacterium GWF2_50_10]